jgi:prephenate dehydrogenase
MNENSEVLIFGMGLMGGSLSLAIKKRYPTVRVTGVVRSEKSKQEIIESKLADLVYTEKEISESLDWNVYQLVIFSTPVHTVLKYISKIPSSGNTIFTDLGSTKGTIIRAVDLHFADLHRYVSSHPMCGSEFSGPASAMEDLYHNKLCILTSAKGTNVEAMDFIRNFWKEIGSWTLEMEPNEHDETLAYLSHLPHILSSLLVQTAIKNSTVHKVVSDADKPITGGGFRDMSRIAGSNFEMWNSIFQENQKFIFDSLFEFRNELDKMISYFDPKLSLKSESIKSIWESARLAKEKIQKLK